MLGWVPKGRAVGRDGARPDDVVLVTGVIGDGYLGLQAAQERLSLEPERVMALVDHYRTPMPRLAFAEQIRDLATAAIDVSDGLIADLGHLAAASGVALDIDLAALPVSGPAQAWLDGRVDPQDARVRLATGGDDYEIAFTARAGDEAELRRAAERQHLRLTTIGRVVAGTGVTVRSAGDIVAIGRPGWTHG